MSTLRYVIAKGIPALVLLGIGFALFAGLYAMRPEQQLRDTTGVVPLVTAAPAQAYDGVIVIEGQGVVVPHREIIMSAETAGSIAEKSPECHSGHWVPAGTELLRIDDRDATIALRQATAEKQQADVQIQELDLEITNAQRLIENAVAEVELAGREKDRLEQLVGRVSEGQIDQARRSFNQAQNALVQQENLARLLEARRSRFESARDLAQVKVERAELDLARTRIVAPSDGVIVSEEVEKGTYVQAGTKLLTFEDTSRVEVQLTLRPEEIYWLLQDRSTPTGAQIAAASEAGFRLPPIDDIEIAFEFGDRKITWRGRLDGFAAHGVDAKTRNVPLRVIVDEPILAGNEAVGLLRRGMFVSLRIPVRPNVPLVAFPAGALKPGEKVWAVRDGALEILDVEVAGRFREVAGVRETYEFDAGWLATIDADAESADELGWIIAVRDRGGLREGDRLVDSPLTLPYDGLKVELRDSLLPTPSVADAAAAESSAADSSADDGS